MARIRYSMTGAPARGTGAFLPRPVGGGHTTPASTTHGIVEVFAGANMRVKAPAPGGIRARGMVGSAVNSNAGPQYIVPDRYATTNHGMGPRVAYSPLQPKPLPVPARQEVNLQKLSSMRARIGGATESTAWPRTFQSYTKKSGS